MIIVALGDIADAGAKTVEHIASAFARVTPRHSLVRVRAVDRVADERPQAGPSPRRLSPEPLMLRIRQSDRDSSHRRMVSLTGAVISQGGC